MRVRLPIAVASFLVCGALGEAWNGSKSIFVEYEN